MKKNKLIAIRIEKKINDFLQQHADKLYVTKSSIIHKLIVDFYKKMLESNGNKA